MIADITTVSEGRLIISLVKPPLEDKDICLELHSSGSVKFIMLSRDEFHSWLDNLQSFDKKLGEAPQHHGGNRDILLETLLSVRMQNCVIFNGLKCRTLGDLTNFTERELLDTKNIGRKSVEEVKSLLATYGLQLKNK